MVGVFNPFSGAKASYGPLMMSGCIPAVNLINKDGGVLGHQLTCQAVDSKGDPADAVPIADKLVATTKNLEMIIGPSSVTAPTIVPIFNGAKVPMFADAGDAEFDKSSFTYFWRLVPPDAADGYAEAQWAHQQGYTRAATIYASDVATTGTPAGVKAGVPALGDKIVYSATLTSAQPSYETVITQMLAAKPQVIFYDAGPRTSATFFSELKSLGSTIPVIGPEVLMEPSWVTSVSGVLGASALQKEVTVVEAYVDTSAAGYPTFKAGLLAAASQVPSASTYTDDPFTIANYDAVNMVALDMLKEHTTNPVTINNTLLSIVTPTAGATVVNSFAQGKAALAAGKNIVYEGGGGKIVLNKYHNTAGAYRVVGDSLNPPTIGSISASVVTNLMTKG